MRERKIGIYKNKHFFLFFISKLAAVELAARFLSELKIRKKRQKHFFSVFLKKKIVFSQNEFLLASLADYAKRREGRKTKESRIDTTFILLKGVTGYVR